MEAAKCPVCQREHTPAENICPNCGWDVTTYRLTILDQVPKAFLLREQARLDWARQVWARLKAHERQKSQEQLAEVVDLLKQQWQQDIKASQEQLIEFLSNQKQQWQQEVTTIQTQLTEILAQIQENHLSPQPTKVSSDNLGTNVVTEADLDNLSTQVGVDYTQLRDLLQVGEWRTADEETGKLMLKVSKRESEGWLREEDIQNFPCTDLRTIDQLWVKYSDGRFGFSVQKRIWEELGGTPRLNIETERKFGDRVGWQGNNLSSYGWIFLSDLIFTTQAPIGHLPGWFFRLNYERMGMLGDVFSRADACNL